MVQVTAGSARKRAGSSRSTVRGPQQLMGRLNGKVAVVTGASRGIVFASFHKNEGTEFQLSAAKHLA